jgi:hypothetical protein
MYGVHATSSLLYHLIYYVLQAGSSKDVISQVTGAMTTHQVHKLIRKTNQELQTGTRPRHEEDHSPQPLRKQPVSSIMKKSSTDDPVDPPPAFEFHQSSHQCNECGAASNGQQAIPLSKSVPFWTPQTHRKGPPPNNQSRQSRNRRSEQKYPFKRAEVAQSVVYPPQKQHQFYSPQVQRRRKSEDLSWVNPQQLQHPPCCESSDSSGDEQVNSPASAAGVQYYGGVRPTYLPNSRTKARKLLKVPQLNPPPPRPPPLQHCQGCCHHHGHGHAAAEFNTNKCSGDDKRCIIS